MSAILEVFLSHLLLCCATVNTPAIQLLRLASVVMRHAVKPNCIKITTDIGLSLKQINFDKI